MVWPESGNGVVNIGKKKKKTLDVILELDRVATCAQLAAHI